MWLRRIISCLTNIMESKSPCWNCEIETEKEDFRCKSCRRIQEIGKTDPYDMFSLKKKYLIDYDELETKYFYLQNIFHPDKFINSVNREKEISAIESSNINNAYNLLIDNVYRINVLLKSNGFKISSKNEKSFSDKDLLEEIMELQSRCMSIESKNEKEKIKKEIKKKIELIELEIDRYFEKRKFNEVENLSVKLSYLEKINKNLN